MKNHDIVRKLSDFVNCTTNIYQ